MKLVLPESPPQIHRNRSIWILFGGKVVYAVAVIGVFFKVTVLIVHANGPEPIDGHIVNGK